MEKPNLPNSTLILIFGILSILTCCCWGVFGLIFGIAAIVLAQKAKEIYIADPDIYRGYNNVKTGKILAIIGVVLSVITLITNLVFIYMYGWGGLNEIAEEWVRTYEMQ